jgi:isopenicillin N synthase-like dioxygenase
VTNKEVTPATHRVVRLPQKERFSMPFEMKPNNDAVLRNLVHPEKGMEKNREMMKETKRKWRRRGERRRGGREEEERSIKKDKKVVILVSRA